MRVAAFAVALLLGAAACAVPPERDENPGDFSHDVSGAATPWTETDFDNAPDTFTFAINVSTGSSSGRRTNSYPSVTRAPGIACAKAWA